MFLPESVCLLSRGVTTAVAGPRAGGDPIEREERASAVGDDFAREHRVGPLDPDDDRAWRDRSAAEVLRSAPATTSCATRCTLSFLGIRGKILRRP
jgi:hypothetical protein